MSWAVGDLALCVDAAPRDELQEVLVEQGKVYRVVSPTLTPSGREALTLEGVVGRLPKEAGRLIPYHVERFRKIKPDEHEACEPEFVTLLKRNRVSA